MFLSPCRDEIRRLELSQPGPVPTGSPGPSSSSTDVTRISGDLGPVPCRPTGSGPRSGTWEAELKNGPPVSSRSWRPIPVFSPHQRQRVKRETFSAVCVHRASGVDTPSLERTNPTELGTASWVSLGVERWSTRSTCWSLLPRHVGSDESEHVESSRRGLRAHRRSDESYQHVVQSSETVNRASHRIPYL